MNTFPIDITEYPRMARTLVWAEPSELEDMAYQQIQNVARLPWTRGVAIMPDVHAGYGVTIGSVIAMEQAVSPSAVGVDIGCGMAAVRTSLTVEDLPDDLGPLRAAIEAAVPVGFHSHDGVSPVVDYTDQINHALAARFMRMETSFSGLRAPKIEDRFSRAMSQCGTLGGGNHFIELCSDEEGTIWITLHSGSRNIGKEIADRHIHKAKGLAHNQDLSDPNLAVVLLGTPEADDYLHDMYWAQDYALLNRHIMLETVQWVLSGWYRGRLQSMSMGGLGVFFDGPIQCHHNYVSEETYDGTDLIITRKGAIAAYEGSPGIIPGSMGTGSYIVEGLGNNASYQSASHGAGRKMSRTEARKTFTEADLAEQTAGVECRKDSGVVDEIPGAYKDINQVMEAQSDLVKPVHRLTTLLCVKG